MRKSKNKSSKMKNIKDRGKRVLMSGIQKWFSMHKSVEETSDVN